MSHRPTELQAFAQVQYGLVTFSKRLHQASHFGSAICKFAVGPYFTLVLKFRNFALSDDKHLL